MTGQPMIFDCQKCRSTIRRKARSLSRQTRTGNTKWVMRQRLRRLAHEYTCTCGHVGWSTHRDITQVPLAGADDSTPDTDPDPDPDEQHSGRGW